MILRVKHSAEWAVSVYDTDKDVSKITDNDARFLHTVSWPVCVVDMHYYEL